MVDKSITFGFEILQKLYDSQLVKKEDVVILFVHWYLIKHGFRCIGLGDSKTFDRSEQGSELLQDGWNTRPNYAIRYINREKLYILHAIKSDEDILLNLLSVADQSVSNLSLPLGETVNQLHGPIEAVIPCYQNVLTRVQQELLAPVLPGTTAEICTQTERSRESVPSENPDPLRVGRPMHPRSSDQRWLPTNDPRNVGVDDLDPFARGGGGGMLYDPFSPSIRNPLERPRPGHPVPGLPGPGILPPGAVPPHARFDPFGPPDANPRVGRPRNPDNDHLPPPGYDDMFM